MTYWQKKDINEAHPMINEFKKDVEKGHLSRRDFLRHATLLGMGAAAACSIIGLPLPRITHASGPIQRGGTYKCAMPVKAIDHPSRLAWIEGSNLVRNVCEYLTEAGFDNVTRPVLLEKWEASADAKTWDLYLRKDVTWNNGDDFVAEDVLFTFSQWFDAEVGSSMKGLLSYIDGMSGVEEIDSHHIRLHLTAPNVTVPEDLSSYPALILHRDFQGDFIKQPLGTGPFRLKEYAEGVRAVFERREDYWQKGEDGKSLPYLDTLMFINLDKDASFAALQGGQVDDIYRPRPSDYMAAKGIPHLKTSSTPTATTYVIRMRTDQAPWDDNRVRQALKLCQDRKKMLRLAGFGEGMLGMDAHAAKCQPDVADRSIPKTDLQKARTLMEEYAKEKGVKLPIKVVLESKNDDQEPALAQALKQMAAPVGIHIDLQLSQPSKYWEKWTEVNFGITRWSHRTLATMLYSLAYSDGAKWNETKWKDEEFNTLLNKAKQTVNMGERKKIVGRLQDIMQERGPVATPYFVNTFSIFNKKFHNIEAHPSAMLIYGKNIWKES